MGKDCHLLLPGCELTTLKPRLLNELDLHDSPGSFTEWVKPFGHPVIWLGQLAESCEEPLEFDSFLSNDEKIRRDRFKRRPDQQRFAAGRAWLRVLLGRYLGLLPRQVELHYGDYGKPYVQPSLQTPVVHFNVAHSGDTILLAFLGSCEVGVDVEHLTDQHDWNDVARQIFSAGQYRAWAALKSSERQLQFFQEWTRREAGLKAIGCGFAIEQPTGWDSQLKFFEIELPPGYAGSVAVRSAPCLHY